MRAFGASNRILRIRIFDHRQHGAELLLVDQPRSLPDVAHDCWLDEIADAVHRLAASNNIALFARVPEQLLDPLVLGVVLHRPQLRALLHAVVNGRVVGDGDEFVAHLVVDRLMDIETLDRHANLAAVAECGVEYAGGDLLGIDVVEDDCGIIAAEFERDALDRVRRARHHLLAGSRGTRERDLTNVGVARERAAEIIGVGNDVEHTRRQQIRHQFGKTQCRELGGRGRLQDACVSGDKRQRQLESGDRQRIRAPASEVRASPGYGQTSPYPSLRAWIRTGSCLVRRSEYAPVHPRWLRAFRRSSTSPRDVPQRVEPPSRERRPWRRPRLRRAASRTLASIARSPPPSPD